MFKKFKDKLAEEMKQSPARLQASMQQLAQAVVSPSLSNNSIQDLSFKDSFSLTEETDETPKNSPSKHGFETVDLTPPSINSSTSRRSSISSNISDASVLFPIYESSGNMFHLQSDMDQSASEIDDNISPQLDRISKEQLYSAYRKARTKYDKYRGRFTDLVSHYRDIESKKNKLESLLVETQDKALRRISDLKEQCQLEQQAKAHLEDALRNDIEEKDHVINSLKIKIKLLQGPNTECVASEGPESHDNDKVAVLVDLSSDTESEKAGEESKLLAENSQLKEKIQKMETFLEKYKDMLKRNKDKILEVTNEKNTLERDYDILQKSSQEKLSNMEKELQKSKEEFSNSIQEIETLKKREEDSVISLAENKLSIHRELEGKEEQIKCLQLELKQTQDLEKFLSETVEKQKQELEKIKLVSNQNADAAQEHLRGKSEALKQMQTEMQQKLIDLDEKLSLKYNEEVNKNKELISEVEELKQNSMSAENKIEEMQKLNQNMREEILLELGKEKEEYIRLLEEHKAENMNLKKELSEKQNNFNRLQTDVDNCDDITNNYAVELKELKQSLADKVEMCNESNLKVQEYADKYESLKSKLDVQYDENLILKDKINAIKKEIQRLEDELEAEKAVGSGLTGQLDSNLTIVANLREKVDNLVNNKNTLIKHITICKKNFKRLKQDYDSLKNNVNNNISNEKLAIFETIRETGKIFTYLNEEGANLKLQVDELSEKNKIIEELKNNCNDSTLQFEQILNEKRTLENELKEMEMKHFNELNTTKSSLELEIVDLKSKLNELDRLYSEREETIKKVEVEKEEMIKNISSLNVELTEKESLNEQLSNLSIKYKEVEEIVHTLKSENEDLNNLIKDFETTETELEKKNNLLKNLQAQYDEEQQHSLKLSSECENYKKLIQENSQKVKNLSKELKVCKEACKKLNIELEKSNDTLKKDSKNIIEAELEREKLSNSIDSKENEIKELQKCNSQLMTDLNNLKENKDALDKLKIEKEGLLHELDALKSFATLLENENKSLKDNQNDLLTLNNVLKHSQSEVTEKLRNLEKKNDKIISENSGFTSELESFKLQIQNNNSEMENLKLQLKEVEELRSKNVELGNLLQEANNCKQENASLENKVKHFASINESLTAEIKSLDGQLQSLKDNRAKSETLEHDLGICRSEIVKLQNALSSKSDELASVSNNSKQENYNLKIELEEKNAKIDEGESKNIQLLEKIDELSLLRVNLEEEKTREVNACREAMSELEETLLQRERELKELEEKYRKLEESAKSIDQEKLKDDELNKNMQNVMLEKMKIESQLDETLVTFQAKETQMQALNEQLKSQASALRAQMKSNEEEQNIRLKKIANEFQAQLYDKERELQAALEQRFDRQRNYESNTIQEYKEQLQDFQLEFAKKSEQMEQLALENEQIKKRIDEEVERRLGNIGQIKSEHEEEMEDLDKKWKHIVDEKTNRLEIQHEQEIAELNSEWQNERKSDENTELLDKEMENTTRVAMAAVQSNTSSFHALQQTLLSQKRELSELRKLVKIRQEAVEDSTEIEYLRNILYKYMMGKETMVLAKVIAAVVKFDQDQTSQILKKEEDKLSLLGSLGLT